MGNENHDVNAGATAARVLTADATSARVPAADVTTAHILALAQTIGLELNPQYLPGVIDFFRLIEGHAALVNEFALEPDVEAAPIFTPCLPPAQA